MKKITLNIGNTVMLPNGKLGTIISQLDKETPNDEIWFEVRDEDFKTEHYPLSKLNPDLFEHYESLPKKVLKVIENQGEIETYNDCKKLQNKLNKLGYDFEWYLDAIPYYLRKI